MRGKSHSLKVSKKIFRRGAGTKKINVSPKLMRGGIRL